MINTVAKKIADMADPKNLTWALAQVLDLKGLSRDLVVAITEKAIKQKDLIVDVMAREFSAFLSKINIAEEAQKILDGMTLDVRASLNFKDKKSKALQATFSKGGKRVTSKKINIQKITTKK